MSDAIEESQRLYRDALQALREQRAQIEEDLAFSDPSDPQQWDSDLKRQRETDPGGARPCLVHDQTGQYVANVAGQVEQRPPSIHAIPAADGAHRKVAEQIDGFFRHIEFSSRAQQHYSRSLTSAARVGVGYLIVRPEFTNRALNYQEPRICSEGDPMRIVFDPWSVELDGSDAKMGWWLEPFSHREFERTFGAKAEKVSFGDENRAKIEDDRESVLVAQQWLVENKSTNMIVYLTPDGDEAAASEDDYWLACKQAGMQLEVRGTYTDKYSCVKWSRMSGAEVLTKETEFPASGIGIVPVYGYVGWSGGRMKYCGIPRRAMEPQRAYNFHVSEMRKYMNDAPKAPWLASKRAVAGLEPIWDLASVQSRAWMPYNDIDDTGQPIPPPQRMALAVNLANHQAGAEQALRDIQAAIGMYQANLGAPSNETSGVAIDSRKQQGEASTAHFPAHLSASVGQVGKLCMEMVPKLIDTKRQLRILGIDNTPGIVTVDPKQAEPVRETPQGLVINPNRGRYDVRVVVGPAFTTQRGQAQAALNEVMARNPALTPAIAPLWAQTLDIPHADKLAQVLTAMAPQPVQAILNPEGEKQPSTAELSAKIEQLQQALQEAIQHAQEATQEAEQAQAMADDKEEDNERALAELELKKYEAETKRLSVTGANEQQIQAIVMQLLQDMARTSVQTENQWPDDSQMHEAAEQPQTYEMQPFPAELPEPNPVMGPE